MLRATSVSDLVERGGSIGIHGGGLCGEGKGHTRSVTAESVEPRERPPMARCAGKAVAGMAALLAAGAIRVIKTEVAIT